MSRRPSLQTHDSVSVHLHGTSFGYEQAHPACGAGRALDHLHPSAKTRQHTFLKLLLHDIKRAAEGSTMLWLSETSCIPFKGVLAFCPEEVNMGLELQFEDVLLVDAVGLFWGAHRVAEQGEARQGEVILQTERETLSQYRSAHCIFKR